MTNVPQNPKIYHITHIRNLGGILNDRVIWSDAKRIELGLACIEVGMQEVKERRRLKLEVRCHSGSMVGEYVPFNFCPRSVMLYILHKGNHPGINYREGQESILHLQADLRIAVEWANGKGVRWAYSDINAGISYAQFYNDLEQIDNIIHWPAVSATDWHDPSLKDHKQAEFLMYESFPLELVEKIGVCNSRIGDEVMQQLGGASLPIEIKPDWYY